MRMRRHRRHPRRRVGGAKRTTDGATAVAVLFPPRVSLRPRETRGRLETGSVSVRLCRRDNHGKKNLKSD